MKTGFSWTEVAIVITLVTIAAGTPASATTPTATPTIACTGDCQGDGTVSETDIDVAVHLVFDPMLYQSCPAYPLPLPLPVAELLVAIQNRADACAGSQPTHTPTATPTPPVEATATPPPVDPTPTSQVPPAVAGRTTIIVNAMAAIPDAVAAIIAGLEFGGASGLAPGQGGAAGACPLGGTATRSGSIPFVGITLNDCKVATGDGTATFNGTASINFTGFNIAVTIVFADSLDQVTRTASAMISGTVSPAFGGACSITGATLTVASGSLTVTTPDDAEVGVTFQNTQIVLDNLVFNDDCAPEKYRLKFNGNAALLTPEGEPSTVTFTNFFMDVDDSASPTLFDLSGAMSSTCFGGSVTVDTPTALAVPSGELCPTAGVLQVTGAGGVATITYGGDGSVTIDQGGMQQAYPNCLDPRLLMCLA